MHTKPINRPLCKNCKLSLSKPNGISKHGFKQWHKYCSSCAKIAYNSKFKHLTGKKTKCEVCNFVAIDKCQLDLIYLNGNKNNKEDNNLKTMCANCSRLYRRKIKENKKTILDITVDTDYTL